MEEADELAKFVNIELNRIIVQQIIYKFRIRIQLQLVSTTLSRWGEIRTQIYFPRILNKPPHRARIVSIRALQNWLWFIDNVIAMYSIKFPQHQQPIPMNLVT